MVNDDTSAKADIRMEQIISAIKDENKEAIRSLFSKKALDEANDFDSRVDELFALLQGDIDSWEKAGWASDESREYGKKSIMIRFSIIINPGREVYRLFIVDYNMDTIDTDNEGIYMMELVKTEDRDKLQAWQERLCAGISIPEEE